MTDCRPRRSLISRSIHPSICSAPSLTGAASGSDAPTSSPVRIRRLPCGRSISTCVIIAMPSVRARRRSSCSSIPYGAMVARRTCRSCAPRSGGRPSSDLKADREAISGETALDESADEEEVEPGFQTPAGTVDYAGGALDCIGFEALAHRDPRDGAKARVYLQIHNRRPTRRPTWWRGCTTPPEFGDGSWPDLPTGFWETFPAGDPAAASPWQPVGPARTVAKIPGGARGRDVGVGRSGAAPGDDRSPRDRLGSRRSGVRGSSAGRDDATDRAASTQQQARTAEAHGDRGRRGPAAGRGCG